MYVEGSEDGVKEWVATVQRLRYKDYQLAARPAPLLREENASIEDKAAVGLWELNSVKELAGKMSTKGIMSWWKQGMGYDKR
ncbi:MAG: hypothetical protein M1822_004706 [Bathelium mastoideum]|nr:MAG: hypothetical protein M1822_004706 [Bathelium mastoideum]